MVGVHPSASNLKDSCVHGGESRRSAPSHLQSHTLKGTVNLSGRRRKSDVVSDQRALFSSLILGTRHLSPLVKRPAAKDAIVCRFQSVPTESEQIVDRSMAR